jgi:hypothetical protein
MRADDLAARWGGMSSKTLANWRSRGQGPPFVKFGSAVRYALTDVVAYEAAGRVEAVA